MAWDHLVEELGPRLYRYFQYKGAADSASDLTQETFIRLVDKYHKYDANQGPWAAFAFGVAQNIWRENTRKTYNWEDIENFTELQDSDELQKELERKDQAEKLKLILKRFPQIQQDIVYFYFDEELTTKEISECLQIPEGTIKSHLHRLKENLKNILEKEWS